MNGGLSTLFRNISIKKKIAVVFFVLLALLINMSIITITGIQELQHSTSTLSDYVVPKTLYTSSIKDNLHRAVTSSVEYVSSDNYQDYVTYKKTFNAAVDEQIQLFALSRSEEDFTFVQSFQTHINTLHDGIKEMIQTATYSNDEQALQQNIELVHRYHEEFLQFLDIEVDANLSLQTSEERLAVATLVERTIWNVLLVDVIAFCTLIALYILVSSSLTKPIEELSRAAEDIGHGQFRYVQIDSTDEIGTFAETFNTMTQRVKATQESLTIELKKTKQLDRQKTEFLSIAAHQLRTPMSGIKWVMNMVVEEDLGPISEDAKEQLRKGTQNVDRMIQMINQLLNVTEIETKGLHITQEPVHMNEFLEPIIHSLQSHADQKDIALTYTDNSRNAAASIDNEKCHMVFQNLIDNAIKYTPESGTVNVQLTTDSNNVVITIADTGYGIPKTERDRIFTKFYRGSNIQTVEADGSGLGLYIAKQIIALHDGDISFTSEEEKGTTFTVSLPLV